MSVVRKGAINSRLITWLSEQTVSERASESDPAGRSKSASKPDRRLPNQPLDVSVLHKIQGFKDLKPWDARSGSSCYNSTDPSTILELPSPSFDVQKLRKICQYPDCEALMVQGSVG